MFEIDGIQENRLQTLPAKAATSYATGEIVYQASNVATKVPAGSSAELSHTTIFLVMSPCNNSTGADAAKNVDVIPLSIRQQLVTATTGTPIIGQVGTFAKFGGAETIVENTAATTAKMGFEIQDFDATNLKAYGVVTLA